MALDAATLALVTAELNSRLLMPASTRFLSPPATRFCCFCAAAPILPAAAVCPQRFRPVCLTNESFENRPRRRASACFCAST